MLRSGRAGDEGGARALPPRTLGDPGRKTVLAPLPEGITAGYGLNLRQLCLMLHSQGQVTTGRLTALLNDIGLCISKRQVVRLVNGQLEGFAAEDAAVLHAGQ
jgi:hypothetical protein